jgi:hypothetical protein
MSADKEKKQQFDSEIRVLKGKIDEINRKIKYLESKHGDNENLNTLLIASFFIDLVSVYCAMTNLSLNLLGYKNESYLDIGRKSLYKALILMEGLVSNAIDIPLNENYELLSTLEDFSDMDKLKLIRRFGYTISLLSDRYGENSKWKWSFVEIEGRYAVIAKNFFNFRRYQQMNNPNVEGFDDRYDYMLLIKDLLLRASNRYREKYELTSHSAEDMKKAVDFLRALKRIHILFKENNDVQSVSKRIELWSQKLEADIKLQDKQVKKQMLSSMGNEKSE